MSIAPELIISSYNPSGVDPSGVRHLEQPPSSGYSFIKNVGTGAGDYLDLGSVNISDGKKTSNSRVVFARLGEFNDMTEAVFNMKFWLPDIDDFQVGTFKFNGFPSGTWIQNIDLVEGSGLFVSTALPSGQNLWRNKDPNATFNPNDDIFKELTASGTVDDQVTMYQYLSVTVGADAAVKTYGGNGGGFTFRVSFDYR